MCISANGFRCPLRPIMLQGTGYRADSLIRFFILYATMSTPRWERDLTDSKRPGWHWLIKLPGGGILHPFDCISFSMRERCSAAGNFVQAIATIHNSVKMLWWWYAPCPLPYLFKENRHVSLLVRDRWGVVYGGTPAGQPRAQVKKVRHQMRQKPSKNTNFEE